MIRALRLLLFAIWLVGAVIGGPPVRSSAPDQEGQAHVLAESQLGRVTVGPNRILLTVRVDPDTRWRVAAPIPSVLGNWMRRPSDARVDHRYGASIQFAARIQSN